MSRALVMTLALGALACVKGPAGGSSAAVEKQRVAADYYPMTVGTSWDYEFSLLGDNRALTVTILKSVDGVIEDSTGAQLMADSFGVRDQKRYLLRNPLENGTRWTNVVSPSSIETYEIISTGAACEAPAGRYQDCVIVESRNRADQTRVLVNEVTFAPGVGIVRLATTLEDGARRVPQSSLTLKRFQAVPPPAVKPPPTSGAAPSRP
jgi:hypothetical protein